MTRRAWRAAYAALAVLCGSQFVRLLRPLGAQHDVHSGAWRRSSVHVDSALFIFSPLLGLKCGSETLCLQKERNAVASWALLSTAVAPAQLHILGFVEQAASCDPVVQATPHVTCVGVPQCVHAETGILTVDCVAREAFSLATRLAGRAQQTFVLVNGDIIFTASLGSAIRAAHARFGADCVLVGRRVDTPLDNLVAMPGHPAEMVRVAEVVRDAAGYNHSVFGLDYFAFPRAAFPTRLPPFLVGRYRWDNVLALEFLTSGVPVIDATESVSCIHQGYTVNASNPNHITRRGAPINAELAKAHSGDAHLLGRIDNAPWRLVGACPACSVVQQEPKLSWAVAARRWAHERTGLLVLLLVRDASMLDAAVDWSRWAHDRRMENYLLLACDRNTFRALTAARLRAELLPYGVEDDARGVEHRSCAWRFRDAVSRLLRFSVAPVLVADGVAAQPHACASLLETDAPDTSVLMSRAPGSSPAPAVVAVSMQPTDLGRTFWSNLKRCQDSKSVSPIGERTLLDSACAAETCAKVGHTCSVLSAGVT